MFQLRFKWAHTLHSVNDSLSLLTQISSLAPPTFPPPQTTPVFPVVMYGSESWSLRKAECQRIDAFELWCWRRLLSPLDCKEIQPVDPKGNQSWILVYISWKNYIYELDIIYQLEGLMLKLQYFGHLMQTADLMEKTLMLGKIEGRRGKTENEMVGWYHRLNGDEFEQTRGDSEGKGAWRAAVHGVAKSRTWLSDWTTLVLQPCLSTPRPSSTEAFVWGWEPSRLLARSSGRCFPLGTPLYPLSQSEKGPEGSGFLPPNSGRSFPLGPPLPPLSQSGRSATGMAVLSSSVAGHTASAAR